MDILMTRLEINVGCNIFALSSDLLGEHPWALTVVAHLPQLLIICPYLPLHFLFPSPTLGQEETAFETVNISLF